MENIKVPEITAQDRFHKLTKRRYLRHSDAHESYDAEDNDQENQDGYNDEEDKDGAVVQIQLIWVAPLLKF